MGSVSYHLLVIVFILYKCIIDCILPSCLKSDPPAEKSPGFAGPSFKYRNFSASWAEQAAGKPKNHAEALRISLVGCCAPEQEVTHFHKQLFGSLELRQKLADVITSCGVSYAKQGGDRARLLKKTNECCWGWQWHTILRTVSLSTLGGSNWDLQNSLRACMHPLNVCWINAAL